MSVGSSDPELRLFFGQSFAKGVVSTARASDYAENGGGEGESAGFEFFEKHM